MSLYIVDIHGDIEGDYEIIGKYEEPFMNKPCVSEKVCEHDKNAVLGKIRAEIENHCGLAMENHCKYCSYCNCLMGVREILELIDKYKTESEEGTADGKTSICRS